MNETSSFFVVNATLWIVEKSSTGPGESSKSDSVLRLGTEVTGSETTGCIIWLSLLATRVCVLICVSIVRCIVHLFLLFMISAIFWYASLGQPVSYKLVKCLSVCLDVNQGGTNRNRCTQRLVMLRVQTS